VTGFRSQPLEPDHVMSLRKLSPLFVVLSSSCLLAPDPDPLVDLRLDALSQYNHRGMVQNETGVLQGEMNVNVATKGEGELDLRSWANLDLDSDTGDAWFPDGHGGEITEAQYSATFTKSFDETSVSVGIFNYSVLNGAEFQQNTAMLADDRAPTTEVFARVAYDLLGALLTEPVVSLTPALIVHYDIDEVEDVYAEVNVRLGSTLARLLGSAEPGSWQEKLGFGVDVHLGYSGEDHSLWAYGFEEAGFSDVRGSADVSYAVTEQVAVRGMIAGGTIIDSDLRDWFDVIGIDKTNFWGSLGVTWSF